MRLNKLLFLTTLFATMSGVALAGQHGGHGGGHGHGNHGGGMHFGGGYGMHHFGGHMHSYGGGYAMRGYGRGYNMNGYSGGGYGGGGYDDGYGDQVIVIENGYELVAPPPPPPYGYRLPYRGLRYAYPVYGNCCPCPQY